ncbi:MAG TPA: hypothetical protein PLP29_12765 [Candidatus Ozemobacteraceae bacterium]|nr:hypothetical protein [Candidatus Ozemobacteraceae bacterium]
MFIRAIDALGMGENATKHAKSRDPSIWYRKQACGQALEGIGEFF